MLLLAPVNMSDGDFSQPLRRACRDFTVFLREKKKKKAKLRSFLSYFINMLFSLAAPAFKNCSKTEHVSVFIMQGLLLELK